MKCLACRLDNALIEVRKHPSETSLRSVENLWKRFCIVPGKTEVDVATSVILSVIGCPKHAADYRKWWDKTVLEVELLAIRGITVRRRRTKGVNL